MMLEALQALTGVFVVVRDGQHALKFTLGRVRGVVGPGVHFKLPIVQQFQVRDTRHTTLDLRPQVLQLGDELIYEVDTKVIYQIVDLHRAVIEIDDLVTGLKNRVVMEVQRVLRTKDRRSIREVDAVVGEIVEGLKPVEEAWGVRIVQFGFSNLSPSPATLEVTQLDLLAREKLRLYQLLRAEGVGADAAVALLSGAVVSLGGDLDLGQQIPTAAVAPVERLTEAVEAPESDA